jgi:hypothetical protein
MRALYVDWYLPRKFRGLSLPNKKPWEIAMIVRSTHFSRSVNGLSPILYCDSETHDYYQKIGLAENFDEIRPVLPLKTNFNPSVFWAAGKFFAIKHCEDPFLMIDLDAEIRFNLNLDEYDVFCTHPEGISKRDLSFYPDPAYLDTKNFFGQKIGINWSNKAYNTCLLYFKDRKIALEYAESALEFMESLEDINPAFENICYILLAEQRFLYDFCRLRDLKVGTLLKGKYLVDPDVGPQSFEEEEGDQIGRKGFLHVWGYKAKIASSKLDEDSFFGTLLASKPDLKEKIIGSVLKSMELFTFSYNNI